MESTPRHSGSYFLVYQPILDLKNRRPAGAEALVRLMSFGRVISPGVFLPAVAQRGKMEQLNFWILARACHDCRVWLKRSLVQTDTFRVSVNISASEISAPGWIDSVCRVVEASGLPYHCLQLEVTEGARLGSPAIKLLQSIKDKGVMLAADDIDSEFGFHNALAGLSLFEVWKVSHAMAYPKHFRYLEFLLKLASALKISLVVEGANQQLAADLHCRFVQSFSYHPPLRNKEIPAALALC